MTPAHRNRLVLLAVYFLATIQFAWCYLWLTRPYVNTRLYRLGRERMPFQGRILMAPVMQWAHDSKALHWLAHPFLLSRFWFPNTVQPEVLVQAAVDIFCVASAGWFTVRIYEASSRRRLLIALVYPLLLVASAATYMMHTVQNFRFIYDLPSLAFFSAAMYLIYFRKPKVWFILLFLVATVNRETTLLLLPLYLIDECFDGYRFQWSRAFRANTLLIVLPLAAAWVAWQLAIRQVFSANPTEFYPRFGWNVKSLLAPLAWPQMLSACGYLLAAVVLLRRHIPDPRLRAWLWIVPVWTVFMFTFGILVETRVFGELIPFVVCSATLIAEEMIVARIESLDEDRGVAAIRPSRRFAGSVEVQRHTGRAVAMLDASAKTEAAR